MPSVRLTAHAYLLRWSSRHVERDPDEWGTWSARDSDRLAVHGRRTCIDPSISTIAISSLASTASEASRSTSLALDPLLSSASARERRKNFRLSHARSSLSRDSSRARTSGTACSCYSLALWALSGEDDLPAATPALPISLLQVSSPSFCLLTVLDPAARHALFVARCPTSLVAVEIDPMPLDRPLAPAPESSVMLILPPYRASTHNG